MRDKIVNDIKYFENFIEEKDELIFKSINGLQSGSYPQENIPLVKHRIFVKAVEKLLGMYSMGLGGIQLRNEYIKTLSFMLDGWDEYQVKFKKGRPEVIYDQYKLNEYCYMVWMLSLAELLNISQEYKNKLHDLVKRDKITDELIVGLSKIEVNNKTATTYKPFSGLFQGNAFSEINENLIYNYLSGWYKNTKLLQWHNYRASIDSSNYYFGNWCLESAAIVVILNLNDYSFRDNVYYPKDLVDFSRAQKSESYN